VKLRQNWRALQIVYVALLASLGIYALMLVVISGAEASRIPTTLDPTLFTAIFGGLGGLTLLAIVPVVRKALMPPRDRVGGGRTLDLDEDHGPAVAQAVSRARAGSIVTWALCESVAVYGLVLSMLLHDTSYYAPFAGVAAAAMLVFAPRRTLLDQVVNAARR
jgi:hypothetical protein